MRHKMPRKIRILSHQRSRRLSRELLKVSNQVSLIVVSALDRRIGPSRTLQSPKDALEPLHPAEQLRWNPHRLPESPFELPRAEGGAIRHFPDAQKSARLHFIHHGR